MPPNKSSTAWRYFDEGRGDDGVKTGRCRLCEEVKIFKLNQNSTSPLWTHLEKAHKTDFDKIAKMDPFRNVAKAVKAKQPTIVSAFQKKDPYGRFHPKQVQFDENLKKRNNG